MEFSGPLTDGIDLALVILYVFWLFFAGLVFYLLREGRREGYPLVDDVTGRREKGGLIWIPAPKRFVTASGEVHFAPDWKEEEPPVLNARPSSPFPGSPIEPIGNPLAAGIGPGSWAMRSEHVDVNSEGEVKIRPMRMLPEHEIAEYDADPRGMEMLGLDGLPAGVVEDLWVDRSEMLVRYVEVRLLPELMPAEDPPADAEAAPADDGLEIDERTGDAVATAPSPTIAVAKPRISQTVLVPMNSVSLAPIYGQVSTPTITAEQFAEIPRLKSPDQINLREEDQIMAYFSAGELYATPQRSEPLL